MSTATEYTFRMGDAVWAKMKGFAAWPGKIDYPPENMKRPAMKKVMHCVFFFGTHDFAWLLESDLKPYQEFKNTFWNNSKKKSNSFKKAINEIEEFLKTGKTFKDMGASSSAEDAQMDADFDALVSGASSKPSTPVSAVKKSTKKRNLSHDSEDSGSSSSTRKTKPAGRPTKKIREEVSPERENSHNHTAASSTALVSSSGNSSSSSKKSASSAAVSNFLDRPTLHTPASPNFDLSSTSQTLKEKSIEPSKLNFGFLGLGIMGSGMVKNLLNSGHNVTVWNRTAEKMTEFVRIGAKQALTPGDVIAESDIAFSCVADPQAAKDMVFGNCGVLTEMTTTKGYVEMTGIDADTSQDIAEAICLKGGRYLEAQVQGSKTQANEGTLVLLVSGDRSLFDDSQSCFQAMGRNTFYLGEVGNASKMNLVLQLMSGVALAGFAEGMALADRAGLQQKDVLEVLGLTSLACPLMVEKGKAIIEGAFPTHHPLQHMQKDLKLALNMGDQLEQPLPLSASANEVFKHAKRLGYGEHDTSAVYIRARF